MFLIKQIKLNKLNLFIILSKGKPIFLSELSTKNLPGNSSEYAKTSIKVLRAEPSKL